MIFRFYYIIHYCRIEKGNSSFEIIDRIKFFIIRNEHNVYVRYEK